MRIVTPETHKWPEAVELFSQSSYTVFLGGSIEMGEAEDWQTRTIDLLRKVEEDTAELFRPDFQTLILNPRRDNWDSSWVQSKDNPQFREQVEWELKAQEVADYILYYFDPNTKAPITLLELGLFGNSDDPYQKVNVVCPEGYWRKGNVDIVCEYYNIRQHKTLEQFAAWLKEEVEDDHFG